jgi:hypothetical protein
VLNGILPPSVSRVPMLRPRVSPLRKRVLPPRPADDLEDFTSRSRPRLGATIHAEDVERTVPARD